MTDALVVITTAKTKEDAEALAHLLVERELAACAQVLPQITSVYRWQGKVEQAEETLLLIKTNRQTYQRLESAIQENHKYQTPEIIAVPVEAGPMITCAGCQLHSMRKGHQFDPTRDLSWNF